MYIREGQRKEGTMDMRLPLHAAAHLPSRIEPQVRLEGAHVARAFLSIPLPEVNTDAAFPSSPTHPP